VTDPPVLAVLGPTASGKSDLAVELARRLPAEIVNADSMQLYAGLDIGTAKLSPAERGGIAHHLLDVWPISRSASVADYQCLAREVIAAVHAGGKIPILVGGSGLYVRAALDRLEFPGESAAIRDRLYSELELAGPGVLHARLAAADPAAAAAILASNGRRIVRALEVIELTGGPFMATMPPFESVFRSVQIGVDRADLDERVEVRVRRMMRQGLLDEVRALLPAGLRASPTAGKALGYAQLLACLDDAGAVRGDLAEAEAITVRATRRFVRRQRSWFRKDPRTHWYDAARQDLVEAVVRDLRPIVDG
jgi:tRNA dimethylallyltransferase